MILQKTRPKSKTSEKTENKLFTYALHPNCQSYFVKKMHDWHFIDVLSIDVTILY